MSDKAKTDYVAKARKAWGGELPGWVGALAEACQAKGVNAVARDVGVSPAAVSKILSNIYAAGTDTMESKVHAALGLANLSEPWINALRAACERDGRGRVALRIGYSESVLCQVLNGTYKGDLSRVEGVVRGAFLDETVMCPVVDEIKRDVCLDNQKRTPPFTSAMRARLYHACRGGCPHYRGAKS